MLTDKKISLFVSLIAMVICTVTFQNCSEGFKSTTLSSSGNGTGGSGGLKAFSLETPPPGTAVSGQVLVSGTCEGTEPVTIGYGDVRDYARIDCVDGQFALEVSFPTSDGTMTLEARQKAPDGQERTSSSQVTKDTVAPVLVDTTASNAIRVSKDNANGQIQCEGDLPIVITGDVEGAPLSANCSNGSHSFSIPLSGGDGSKSVTFTQQDDAGNSNFVTLAFTKDTIAPTVTVGSPAANTEFTGSVVVNGSCESGTVISFSSPLLDNAANVTCTESRYEGTVNFQNTLGAISLTVTATDAAGNSANQTLNLTQVEGLVNVTLSHGFSSMSQQSGTVTIGFSDNVTGLQSSDFTLSNANINNLSGSGATYTLNLSASNEGPFSLQLNESAVTTSAGAENQASAILALDYVSEKTPTTISMQLVDAPATEVITLSENSAPLQLNFSMDVTSGEDTQVAWVVSECFGPRPSNYTEFPFQIRNLLGTRVNVTNRQGGNRNIEPDPMPEILQMDSPMGITIPAGQNNLTVNIQPQALPGFHNGLSCTVDVRRAITSGAYTGESHSLRVESSRSEPQLTMAAAVPVATEGQNFSFSLNLSAPYQFNEEFSLLFKNGPKTIYSMRTIVPGGETSLLVNELIKDDNQYDLSNLTISLIEPGRNGVDDNINLGNLTFNNSTPMPAVSFKVSTITLSESIPTSLSSYFQVVGSSKIPIEFSWQVTDQTAIAGDCSSAGQDYVSKTPIGLTMVVDRNYPRSGAQLTISGRPVIKYTHADRFQNASSLQMEACGDLITNASARQFRVQLNSFTNVASGTLPTVNVVIEDDDSASLKVTRLVGNRFGDVKLSPDDLTISSMDSDNNVIRRFRVNSDRILTRAPLVFTPFDRPGSFAINGTDVFVSGAADRQSFDQQKAVAGFRQFTRSGSTLTQSADNVQQDGYYAGTFKTQGTLIGHMQDASPWWDADRNAFYENGRLTVYEKSGGNWNQTFQVLAPSENEAGRTRSYNFDTDGSRFVISHSRDPAAKVYEKNGDGEWELSATLRGDLTQQSMGLQYGSLVQMDGNFVILETSRSSNRNYFLHRWDGSEWLFEGDLKDIAPTPSDIGSHHTVRWSIRNNHLSVAYYDFEDYYRIFVFRWNGTSWVSEADIQLPQQMFKSVYSNVNNTFLGPAIPFGGNSLLLPGAWVVKYE